MASVYDVAEYILEKKGPISTMKLQKLVYYSQAWSTVWDDPPDTPIFPEKIQAWVNGPVAPDLYEIHKGSFTVEAGFTGRGDPRHLSENQRDTVDAVLEYYGVHSAQWLSDLAHREDPWRNARKGLTDTDRGRSEITLNSMQEYYSSLAKEQE